MKDAKTQMERGSMKECFFCRKRAKTGYNVSHSHKKTKRTFSPNLFAKNISYKGKRVKVKICSACLKRMGK